MGKAWGGRMVGNLDWEKGFGIREKGRQDIFSYPWTIGNLGWIIFWCGVLSYAFLLYKKSLLDEFPGCPMIRTLISLLKVWVQSPVRELRSHMPRGVPSKKSLLDVEQHL